MTRKKTTTGTMGSKRKTEQKPAAAKAEKAATAKPEHKAGEVIPEVAVALLQSHPTLPDKASILEHFTLHFLEAKERQAAPPQVAPAPAAPPQAEPEAPTAFRKRRASEPVAARATSSWEPPAAAKVAVPEPVAPVPVTPEPTATPEPESIVDSLFAEVEASNAAPAEEPVAPFFAELEGSRFAAFDHELEAEVNRAESADIDDIFASPPSTKTDGDFDFAFQATSDQSSPFLSTGSESEAAAHDVGATRMISAIGDDDLGTPVAQEALDANAEPAAAYIAPNESTTMIQAMPDDEPARETDTVRRSRKSSKKRRG